MKEKFTPEILTTNICSIGELVKNDVNTKETNIYNDYGYKSETTKSLLFQNKTHPKQFVLVNTDAEYKLKNIIKFNGYNINIAGVWFSAQFYFQLHNSIIYDVSSDGNEIKKQIKPLQYGVIYERHRKGPYEEKIEKQENAYIWSSKNKCSQQEFTNIVSSLENQDIWQTNNFDALVTKYCNESEEKRNQEQTRRENLNKLLGKFGIHKKK